MSAIVKVSGQSLAEQARNTSTGSSAAFQIDEFVTLFVVIDGGIEFENIHMLHMHMCLHVYIVNFQGGGIIYISNMKWPDESEIFHVSQGRSLVNWSD